MNYYSPELVGYIQETGTAAAELTQQADIIPPGPIYAEYLTGALPPFDASTSTVAAARAGEVSWPPSSSASGSPHRRAGRPDAAGRPGRPTGHRRDPHDADGHPYPDDHDRGPGPRPALAAPAA